MSKAALERAEQEGWLKLFAGLANIESWSDVSPGHVLVLEETLATLMKAGPVKRRGVDPEAAWQVVRPILLALVDGGEATFPLNELSRAPRLVDGVLQVYQARDAVLVQLAWLLLSRRSRFLRCSHCRRIAPRGPKANQRYCTPTCRSRAADASRRAGEWPFL